MKYMSGDGKMSCIMKEREIEKDSQAKKNWHLRQFSNQFGRLLHDYDKPKVIFSPTLFTKLYIEKGKKCR